MTVLWNAHARRVALAATALLIAGALLARLWWPPAAVPAASVAVATGIPGAAPASAPASALAGLLQRQSQVSQSMARAMHSGAAAVPAPGVVPGSAHPSAADKAGARTAAKAEAELHRRAIREAQSKAVAEIMAVPPGDTKRMLSAVQKFDAQMRAAGAPALIDMDNLRKMLEGSNRLQELNRQLITEAEKGRGADVARVKALSQEIGTVQAAMPRQFVNRQVLQSTLAQ